MLNEGSRRGGLGEGDGFELVCGSLGGVLALLHTIDITSAGAPASIQERKLREKSEMRNKMRENRSEWGFCSREEAEREE